jgi:UDP-N-acetyl-D-glucosamine dehydrogenase
MQKHNNVSETGDPAAAQLVRPGVELVKTLKQKIENRSAVVVVCGMGYVGLPLACAVAQTGFRVIGADIDKDKVNKLNSGHSYIAHIPAARIQGIIKASRFHATSDFAQINDADIIVVCVPTPLSKNREPDLTYVVATAELVAQNAHPGQLFILESTTYPGTTDEVIAPIFRRQGFTPSRDIFLAFSPEREDPGNPHYSTQTVPRVVGAQEAHSLELATTFYGSFIKKVVPVSSTATAEAVKLTENIFRAVNIALMNELKIIYFEMGIDVWEVIEAAKTKPYGFMPFYPGPGLGGHCIPIDPFYLTWKAREFGIATRFIELAGELNAGMPQYAILRLTYELDQRFRKGLNGACILVSGLAYKKNVDDMRESPALKLIELLEKRGAVADYYDPHIPEVPATRDHPELAGRRSVPFDTDHLIRYDAVIIATDHECIDYKKLVDNSKLVMDTRNVCARIGLVSEKIAKA